MWPRSGFCPERSIRRGEVLSEQMQTALTHRAIIERAKGVLAHQGDLSMHAVFDRLRSYARNRSKRPRRPAQVVEGDLGEDLLTVPHSQPRPARATVTLISAFFVPVPGIDGGPTR
jgi:ANTAR domain